MFLEVVLKTMFKLFYPQHSTHGLDGVWTLFPSPLITKVKFGKYNSYISKSGQSDRAQRCDTGILEEFIQC